MLFKHLGQNCLQIKTRKSQGLRRGQKEKETNNKIRVA